MKKKIALLLVLAMIISLVPANLFAAPAQANMGNVSNIITESTHDRRADGNSVGWVVADEEWNPILDFVTVSINMVRLRNVGTSPTSLHLRVELDPAGAYFPWTGNEFRPLTVDYSQVRYGLGLENELGAVSASFLRINNTTGIILLEFEDEIFPSTMQGYLAFEMPIARVRNDQVRLVLRSANNATAPELVNDRIASFPGRGIRINEGDVVYFDWTARLNPIEIEELVARALRDATGVANHIAIRFVAPPNYFWSNVNAVTMEDGSPSGTINTNVGVHAAPGAPRAIAFDGNPDYVIGAAHGHGGNAAGYNNAWTYFRTPGDGRHELLFVLTGIEDNPSTAIADLMGTILINNLVLVPGENAPQTGDVRIDIHVGIFAVDDDDDPVSTVPCTEAGGGGGSTTGRPAGQIWICGCPLANCPRWQCPNPCANQWVRLSGTGHPQAYRTNVLVARRVRPDLVLSYYDELPELRSGHAINRAANVLVTGETATVLLTENVPGALGLSLGHPITFTFPEGVQVVGVQYYMYNTIDTPWFTRGTGTGINATFAGNTVTIRHDLASSSAARELEVNFRVSVEAGFAAAHGDTIEVRVDGTGAARLSSNYVDVAEVWDPVTVVSGEPVGVSFVGRDNNIPRTPVEDIVIEETRYGALEVGDHLWIYVARQLLPRPWDIALVAGDVVVDQASGLTLQVVRNHRVQSAGNEHMLLQLTVLTSSHTEDVLGRITLSGAEIFGLVYQDEIYYLAVTGNAIAANHSLVANTNRSVAGGLVQHGAFDSIPYGGLLLTEIPPDHGVTPPSGRANSLDGFVFNPTVAVANVLPPVMWYRAEGMRFAAGFIAARSFAYATGAEIVLWESSTREAFVAGWNYQGEWTSILLTQGSTVAVITIDGVSTEHDIAEFAGQSGPSGTLAPIFRENRIYLPARFLFNAFGYGSDYTFSRVGDNLVVEAIR